MRSGWWYRTLVRAISAPIVVLLLAGSAAAGPAETRKKISDAKARLELLEGRIAAQERHVLGLNEELKALALEVGQNRRAFDAMMQRLVRTQLLRRQTQERYAALREDIDRAAAAAYIRGNAFAIEALLGSESIAEVTEVIAYTRSITATNAELADEVNRLAYELQKQEHEEAFLVAERDALLQQLTAKQEVLTARFVEQQLQLASLARDRAEVGSLINQLRKQLRAEELAAAQEALRNGTPLTFGQWAEHFLNHIKAPVARNNLIVMVAWQVAEYTQARWNPLATTYYMPGSTQFNSHGVRNYVSLAQGVEATRRTLAHCCYGYEKIVVNLARNADPMTTAQAINESRWCYGCAGGGYVVDLIPTVEKYYDDYAAKSA